MDVSFLRQFERYPKSETTTESVTIGNYQLDLSPHRHLTKVRYNPNSIIYPATNTKSDHRVMIKFDTSPNSHLPENKNLNTLKEYLVLSSLNHPNIPHAYEVVQGNLDTSFQSPSTGLVMQLIDGTSQEEVMDFCVASHTSPNIPHVLDQFAHIADALHFAHLNHITHEDLKPGNIVVATESQIPYLIDWESAENIGKQPPTIIGTTRYFCPEKVTPFMYQRLGINRPNVKYLPSPAGDTYSFAVCCYELLTGLWPFESTNTPYHKMDIGTKFDRIMTESPKTLSQLPHLRNQNPRTLHKLDKLFTQALNKNPRKRFQDPRQLISILQNIVSKDNLHILPYPEPSV